MTAPAPRWANELDVLATVAGDLIAKRVEKYPEQVERGLISAEDAATGTRIMAAIAHDWRRHVDLIVERKPGTAPEPAPATRAERIATLEKSAAGAAARSASKPGDLYRAEYAEVVATLLWWERDTRGIRFITDTNLVLRRRLTATAEAA